MSKPLRRIDSKTAAEMLGVCVKTLNRMQIRDVFTVQQDTGVGRAKRFFFLDEIELYIEANAGGTGKEGERAVLALRIEKRRKRKR
jgi:hypothetical protein